LERALEGRDAGQIVGKGIASDHVPHIAGVVAPVSGCERRECTAWVQTNLTFDLDVRGPDGTTESRLGFRPSRPTTHASRVTRPAAADPSRIEPNPQGVGRRLS
jgi:hypothetical protein